MIWSYEDAGHVGLIVGLANDGVCRGTRRVASDRGRTPDGKVLKSGCLDAGYPLPGKLRQAQLVLPQGTKWEG